MDSCKITYIYGLYEVGKEDEIRYVGKTNNPKLRKYLHLKRKDVNKGKVLWISKILESGGQVEMKILEECADESWTLREKYWIAKYNKNGLLFNIRSGGQYGKCYTISFEDCKKWVSENCKGVDTIEKWEKVNKPDFIPNYPPRVFPEFKTWGDFLGTNRQHNIEKTKKYLSIDDAIDYIKKLEIKSGSDWIKKYNCGLIPDDLFPKKPQRFYKKRGWISWGHFLSTGRVANQSKVFVSYLECREFAKANKIDTQRKWSIFKKPENIPSLPPIAYKNEWKSWQDFFGRKTRNKKLEYLTLEECKKLLILNNIKSIKEYKKFCKSRTRELRIPGHPDSFYNDWKGWSYLFN
jgi:hypothetical protein